MDGGPTIVVDGRVVAAPAPPAVDVTASEPVAAVPLRARAPHAKPGAITCADISGPNLVRFKLREGTAARFDVGSRSIVADPGARLSSAAASEQENGGL